MDCIMQLFHLGLLPPSLLLLESEGESGAQERLPRPSNSMRSPASSSLLSRAFARSGSCVFHSCGAPTHTEGQWGSV